MKLTRKSGRAPEATALPAGEPATATATERAHATRDVNLVPALVRDTIAVRRIRKAFTWVAVLCVAGLAALWMLQVGPIDAAQQRLDTAQSESVQLTAKVKALAPIGQLYTLLTDQEDFIAGALATQVKVAEIQDALQSDAGKGIAFTNLALTNTGLPKPGDQSDLAVACPDADPFTADLVVGCVSFTATGESREQVAAFLDRAGADPLFLNPYVTTTTVGQTVGGQSQVTFSGSAGLSAQALVTPLSQEEADKLQQALEAARNPEPSPSSSPSASGAAAGGGSS